MKLKILLLVTAAMLFISACGTKQIDQMTFMDHENNEVTIPQDQPVLLFYITTYT